ncbi:MAG TPA: hypothetical protein VGK06_04475 [Methanosarcina sp.]|jgi:hypothetical protein
MESITTNMVGERFPVMAYVDPATFNKIEQQRGDVSRSRYVGKILMKALQRIEC